MLMDAANSVRMRLKEQDQQIVQLHQDISNYSKALEEAYARIQDLYEHNQRMAQQPTLAGGSESTDRALASEEDDVYHRLQRAESLLIQLGYEQRSKGWVRRRVSRRSAKQKTGSPMTVSEQSYN